MNAAPVHLVDLSPAQRQVLIALKRRGEASADELAEVLSITSSAVRQHLGSLRSAGLVASRHERGRAGRPVDIYHSTHEGEALFGRTSGELSAELLGYIEEEDPSLVRRVFEQRQHHRAEQVREQLAGKTLDEKVAVMAEVLDAEGYMAEIAKTSADHYRVTLCSCAIWEVASRYPQACSTELEFLKDALPEADIERVAHKVAGAFVCGYEVGPRPESPFGPGQRDLAPA